jgi:hypothetical protein
MGVFDFALRVRGLFGKRLLHISLRSGDRARLGRRCSRPAGNIPSLPFASLRLCVRILCPRRATQSPILHPSSFILSLPPFLHNLQRHPLPMPRRRRAQQIANRIDRMPMLPNHLPNIALAEL